MADHPLHTVTADQEAFVKELFERNEELRAYHQKKIPLQTSLCQQSVNGIRTGIDNFVAAEKSLGRAHGENFFDYDISRFMNADLKTPIVEKLSESRTVREHCVLDFKLGLFESAMENIASIVSESYKGHALQLYMGEVSPTHANQNGRA